MPSMRVMPSSRHHPLFDLHITIIYKPFFFHKEHARGAVDNFYIEELRL
jgi:hypothetical protein